MDEAVVIDFLKNFDENRYPSDFQAEYEPMECFSHHEAGETLLVKSKKTGAYFIAKCYDMKNAFSQTGENEILKKLHHEGIPAYIAEYRNDKMLCVIREYVDGKTLDQYASENGLTQEQIISVSAQLCDILGYLHGQTQPVIHRDIKPQNIMIEAKGKIKLIDFGISRVYNKVAREDTICFGTRDFASPEQYGFSQTDCRADIFSVGVLICWLLTGETNFKDAAPKISNKSFYRIIKRCTAFEPDKRYPSVLKLKSDLMGADGQKRKRNIYLAASLFSCMVFFCLGLMIGHSTRMTPLFRATTAISFDEPLVEQAVRHVLNKGKDDTLTEKDILSVNELYVFGDKTAGSRKEYEDLAAHMVLSDGFLHNGRLTSLKDLAMLKNLRSLNIAFELIEDLSPLKGLTSLEHIDLKHNLIKDVSPLASLPLLKNLCLFDTRISDLSSLSSCHWLESIDCGGTFISSMAEMKGLESLKGLYMKRAPIETLSGIDAFSHLEQISLSGVADADLTPLLTLPMLKEVNLDEALRDLAEHDLKQPPFDIVYQK